MVVKCTGMYCKECVIQWENDKKKQSYQKREILKPAQIFMIMDLNVVVVARVVIVCVVVVGVVVLDVDIKSLDKSSAIYIF